VKKLTVYWIWLAELKGIGLRNKRQLLEFFRDPEEIFLAKSDTLPPEIANALEDKDLSAARAIEKTCARQNIGILTYADEAYPEMLRTLEDPPLVLYYQGKLPDWQAQPLIGVVGTRKASPYGLHTARLLSAQIQCGLCRQVPLHLSG
jgi:DNA processing protein